MSLNKRFGSLQNGFKIYEKKIEHLNFEISNKIQNNVHE